MKSLSILITIAIVLTCTSCARATVSDNRAAYILSHTHGWIEITITDEEVPPRLPPEDLTPEELAEWEPSPPYCRFDIELNNENFVTESIFPFGEEPPYRVRTGFRFPAPAGEHTMTIRYRGCDIENDDSWTVSYSTSIFVDDKRVTPILFDGSTVTITESQANEVVTLEDIYNEIK